ncbi:hypothetical protein [Lentzea cavernae]|uniref:Excreted virulence factor EspC, type VII ESX diderm n=1 Tax=Lentzea cavernae TaxID=2020703 RepID=A0ABQ3MR99_9PSEU|nr:hypothetical protein [Lentzea cavernae]GHH57890.1 hypothetical protein GCM10017774_78350 [Lentzea cavernae]
MDEVMRHASEQGRRALETTGEGMRKILDANPMPSAASVHAAVEVIIQNYAAALAPVVHALGEDARALGASWREAAIRAAREQEGRRG